MQSYHAFREEINGLNEIHETVKTIEKVAALSLQSLKLSVSNLNGYLQSLHRALNRVSLFYERTDHPLLTSNQSTAKALVIIGGNQGLAGGIYHDLVNAYLLRKSEYQSIFVIGKKVKQMLDEEHIDNYANLFLDLDLSVDDQQIDAVMENLFEQFKAGTYSQIDLLYPKFVSVVQQVPAVIPFLPFQFIPLVEDESLPDGFPIFERPKAEMFDRLLEKYIKYYFYKVMLEAKLSEFSARTIAMEHAAQKSKELSKKLTVSFLKTRRRIATQKQLESFTVNQTL